MHFKEINHLDVHQNNTFFYEDLDGDDLNEIAFEGKFENQLIIARHDLRFPIILDLPEKVNIPLLSVIKKNNKTSGLFLWSSNHSFTVNYAKNPLYTFRFAYYPLIYLIILSIVLLISKTQRHRLNQIYLKEKYISELQLKSSINQIEPHFTLNIIESLASLFDKNDKKKAIKVFGRFSKMLRNTLINSDKILVTLKEELDYVDNYLTLMKFRYNDKFNHEISLPENIDLNIQIPKTLIQTFAENAIKHGIRHLKDDNGLVTITILKNYNNLQINITDNGIGREKSKDFDVKSTGKGLAILDEILDYYNRSYKKKISYSIEDNDSDDLLKGTMIIIILEEI